MRSKEFELSAVRALVGLGDELRQAIDPGTQDFQWHYNSHGWINVAGPVALKRIAKSLSTDDLCCLIVGMTYAERQLKWIGGSVGSVSFLFKHLEESSPYFLEYWQCKKSVPMKVNLLSAWVTAVPRVIGTAVNIAFPGVAVTAHLPLLKRLVLALPGIV